MTYCFLDSLGRVLLPSNVETLQTQSPEIEKNSIWGKKFIALESEK